ncbi:MAG: 4-hydroxy-tetrahydrodipicolinate reductase, partial [Gammaproteobacteria bacterium]
APNFSLGAILMMRYAKDAARYFSHIDIIEKHHTNKKDAPSGTALKTAQMIQTATGTHPSIHSIRLPGIVAEQEVLLGGEDETLSIYHRSIDRRSFMPGVRLACKRVVTLDKLIYGLEEILD